MSIYRHKEASYLAHTHALERADCIPPSRMTWQNAALSHTPGLRFVYHISLDGDASKNELIQLNGVCSVHCSLAFDVNIVMPVMTHSRTERQSEESE